MKWYEQTNNTGLALHKIKWKLWQISKQQPNNIFFSLNWVRFDNITKKGYTFAYFFLLVIVNIVSGYVWSRKIKRERPTYCVDKVFTAARMHAVSWRIKQTLYMAAYTSKYVCMYICLHKLLVLRALLFIVLILLNYIKSSVKEF